MIKRFRIKFIAIFMSFVVIVMSFFLHFIQNNFERQMLSNMRMFASQSIRYPDLLERTYPLFTKKERINIMLVKFDGDYNFISSEVKYGSMDLLRSQESIKKLSQLRIKAGNLPRLDMIYTSKKTDYGYIYAVVDIIHIKQITNELLLSNLLLGALVLFMFLIVSFLLSSYAIHPIAKAMKQQKDFVADVSHELKTPITILLSNIELLNPSIMNMDSNTRKWFGNIKNETTRMQHLVNDLLFLARQDISKENNLDMNSVNLNRILMYCILNMEAVLYESHIDLVSNIPEDNLVVLGDDERLKQLILILLDNALKHGGENGTITLSLTKNNDKAIVKVHNTGKIIPKETIGLIFDRFYMEDKSRSRRTGGHGLGLSIAAEIVKLHKGSITAASSEEKGTEFKITFPLTQKGDAH